MASFQVLGWNMHRHIVELTKQGVFDKHQAARTVLLWLAMNISISNKPGQGLRRGFVMEAATSQAGICRSTGLGQASVSRAVSWLRDEGLISVTYRFEGTRQRIQSMEIMTYDEQSEADRQAKLQADRSFLEAAGISPEMVPVIHHG